MQFGDTVVYVKDGKPLNALVVKSQGDALNLIYLDPASESFVAQGNQSRLASTAVGVKPLAEGAKFGWAKEAPLSAPEQLDEVQGAVPAGDPASPHALTLVMPSDPTSLASVDDAKATALAQQINANLNK